LANKLGILRWMRNGEAFIPLATGFKGLPYVPKRQPLRYQFMPRIETAGISANHIDHIKWPLREQVAQAIQIGIAQLQNKSQQTHKASNSS
ncbi:MAG: hypothetical protein VXW65_11085, partial [Pseudomonadota bacterium]|nr:hypothetical protein [Pseudomonadota bacterium]